MYVSCLLGNKIEEFPFNLACLYIKSLSSSFFHPIKYPVIFPLRWTHGTVPHCIVMLDDVEAMKLRSTGAADGARGDTLKTNFTQRSIVLPASLVTAINIPNTYPYDISSVLI